MSDPLMRQRIAARICPRILAKETSLWTENDKIDVKNALNTAESIEELTEINIAHAETIREQQKLIDEMMVVIKDQNKTLIELLVLTIVAWAYAFFSAAWCV